MYACKGGLSKQTERKVNHMSDDREVSVQAKGGQARAAALSADERRAIAQQAAFTRWHGDMPRATHEGELAVAGFTLRCAVLDDGRRVLSERGVLRALGIRPGGAVFKSALLEDQGDARLPMFVGQSYLRPFIDNELLVMLTQPIMYRPSGSRGGGRPNRGLEALLIPKVCEVWLRARDARVLQARQLGIASRADALMRGLARTGIIALVDEATGYQEVRDRLALQKILDAYLSRELAAWAKRFPDEFYNEIFRLRGWDWERKGSRRPVQVAKDTINLVYLRMLPDLVKELEDRNPKDEKGRRRAKHHQFFSVDVGSPALNAHLHAVITLMRAFDSWEEFKQKLDRSLPVVTKLVDLPLFNQDQPVASIAPPPPGERSPSDPQTIAS
jgi:P63C domain-containing protein